MKEKNRGNFIDYNVHQLLSCIKPKEKDNTRFIKIFQFSSNATESINLLFFDDFSDYCLIITQKRYLESLKNDIEMG